MDLDHLKELLINKALLDPGGYRCRALTGGVSSEIYLVSDGVKSLVVKKALPRLKVRDNWEADIDRNRVEQDFIRYLQAHLPSSLPKIVYSDRDKNFFVMEYLGRSCTNWKEQLLAAHFNARPAGGAGELLASIHRYSQGDPVARETFSTTANFMNLRIAPYLITTAERNPDLREVILSEAERLSKHRECLVHGDFSPKNILVCDSRLVLLDHEVAWYGDPAFDVAFMLTHLHLKQIVHHTRYRALPDLPKIFWEAYFQGYIHNSESLAKRVNKLWLLLLLARVDGKSPVEYLENDTGKQKVIRTFVYEALKSGKLGRKELTSLWEQQLKKSL